MTQAFRSPSGGSVDRARPLRFTFDGVAYTGFAGDTLASALLANGVHLVARSFKYHRPRGIVTAGVEEPNALVQVGEGARTEPNVRATTLELYDGLVATSQNRWPSLRVDAGIVNNFFSRLLPAGFYYKTFMWPASPRGWLRYEHWIRRMAGLGRAASAPDPDSYEHRYAHCDVLVIGGGPAGLAAARAAMHAGARVLLCDERPALGGSLVGGQATVDGIPADAWLAATVRELESHPQVSLLRRTTAFGYYDGNLVGLVERSADANSGATPANAPRQRLWKVRAKAVVLASGAIERGIAYANNDLPGTMLADAARTYVNRYAVMPGKRAVVFTNNDSAYACALDLHRAGVEVVSIVDVRADADLTGALPHQARDAKLPVLSRRVIASARGGQRVSAVDIVPVDGGPAQRIDCDVVCVSGGWNPTVHLFSQARGTLRYEDALSTFVPASSSQPIEAAGAAAGHGELADVLADGHAAGRRAAQRAGVTRYDDASGPGGDPSSHHTDRSPRTDATAPHGDRSTPQAEVPAPRAEPVSQGPIAPLWAVAAPHRGAKRFVDLQNDVGVDDIALAAREGYQSVEHLKRYTTLGMGTDQGKISNITGLALLAEQLKRPIASVGTTTFRPPYTPVTLGAMAGREVGAHVEPTRYSSIHDWHVAHGARFVTSGLWLRPHSYPRTGESPDDAANREAKNVRTNVGLVDVSTLGKIELQGRDVTEFLNRVYGNRWDTLAIARCRYGIMLRDDGIVLDDGTTSRLAANHYLMTTTTANAVRVLQYLEALLQVDWPELDVYVASVTEHWAAAALSGPRSREVLARVVDIDVGNEAFPFLALRECTLRTAAGAIPARLFRISYSGELAYEVHVPANHGRAMWEALLAAGEASGTMPYGTEAMSTLRIEKGHVVVGAEADGRTTADDLGMGALVYAGKWCIGKPLLARAGLVDSERWQLVGLTGIDGSVPRGGKLVTDPDRAAPNPMEGHVTSWCWSPNLDASIALALLARGRERHGETLWAMSPLAGARVKVRVGPPCFIDVEGARLRG